MNQSVELPASLAGERIDRVLSIVFERSRKDAADLISEGRVRLSGEVIVRGHRKVSEGDLLEVELPEEVVERRGPQPDSTVAFEVVYVDDHLIVIDKPAGVVVHPGAGHEDDTLVSGLLHRFPDLAEDGAVGEAERPGIVHRLDKDTSGLLVVARTEQSFLSLSSQLRTHAMARGYVALCLGSVSADEGVIDAPIGRSLRDRTKMAVSNAGRSARTHYRCAPATARRSSASLLDVDLETGRTHQIRVHLSAIGHPVAGDRRYGGAVGTLSLSRPFLHAARLTLTHPTTGEVLQFSSALPSDLTDVLAVFEA